MSLGTSDAEVIKANYFLRVEVTARQQMSCSEQVRCLYIPIQILATNFSATGTRDGEIKNATIPDITKPINQDYNLLKNVLKYPKVAKMPEELKPVTLPGGHYKLEEIKTRNGSNSPEK